MNNLKEKYELMSSKVKLLEEELQELKANESEQKEEYNSLKSQLAYKILELHNLKSKKQSILNNKDTSVNRIINSMLFFVTIFLALAGYNIASLIPNTNMILKVLGVIGTFSIAGSLDLATLAALKFIEEKINERSHKKIARTNSKYIKLAKEIQAKEKEYNLEKEQMEEIKKNIQKIASEISSQNSLIRLEKQELSQLESEIINFVIEPKQVASQETKPYTKVKTQDNK